MNLVKTRTERNALENRVQKTSIQVENPQCYFLCIFKRETYCRAGIEGIGSPAEAEWDLTRIVFHSTTFFQTELPLIAAAHSIIAWKKLEE